MHKIINYSKPEDFVIATGQTHSIRDFCKITFQKLGLNYKDYVVQKEKYFRPSEVKYLRGDSKKAKKLLKWKPKYTLDKLIDEMINYWLNYYKRNS